MSTLDTYAVPATQQRPQRAFIHELDGVEDPDEIVTDAPAEQFRLGYLDVVCLILNRVIGESGPSVFGLSFEMETHGVVSGFSSLMMG